MIRSGASCYFRPLQAVTAFLLVAGLVAGVLASGGPAGAQVSALKDHDTAQAIDITADRLEVRDQENMAVFSGSVEAVQGDLNISADSITVYYEAASDGADPTILRLDMAGHARLVSPSENVTSEWAVYDVKARLLTLGGSVVLGSGDSVLRGERLELDLESGVTKFEGAPTTGEDEPSGRVRGRFSVPDQGEDGNEEESEQREND